MKERYELRGHGKDAYMARFTKNHWWNRWEAETNSDGSVKKYPVDQENCYHRLRYAYQGMTLRGIPFPIYRCEKCGYEQVGTTHLEGNKYED